VIKVELKISLTPIPKPKHTDVGNVENSNIGAIYIETYKGKMV
jgi:hypothetical protein